MTTAQRRPPNHPGWMDAQVKGQRRRSVFVAAGFSATLLILAWGLLRAPQNAFDDAFITYRYATNLRNGLGLVYNPGEWVLGTTAPLYTILLAGLSSLGGTAVWWGHWVSIAAWIVSAWTAMGLMWVRAQYAAGVVAALLIAVLPWFVPALGMETAFLVALLLLTSRAWMSDRRLLAPILSALAILTRQDAALFVGLLFVAQAIRSRRIPWREGLLVAALVLPWFVYAFWRYGTLLPQSALSKINQNQLMAVAGSRSFAAQLFVDLGAGSPLAAIAVAVSGAVGLYVIVRFARAWWWLPCWVLLYVAIYVGLNVAPFPWYFVPPLTGIIFICAIGLGWLLGDCRSASIRHSLLPGPPVTRLGAAAAIVCVLVLGVVYAQRTLAASMDAHPGYMPAYRDVGAWLAAHTPPDARVAAIEIGVIGYLSQRPILDTMGLVSPQLRGHLVGWAESLTYAVTQLQPEYAVALQGTAWDGMAAQPWFQAAYRPVVAFDQAIIYQRQPAMPLTYRVNERTAFASGFAVTGLEAPAQALQPGAPLRFVLNVEVAQNPDRDCTIITYLVDIATYARLGVTQGEPFGGGYSCAVWQPGDALHIPLEIAVPEEIAPGAYRIGVELMGADGSSFTLQSNPDAHEVRLGWLRAGNPARPAPAFPWRDVAAQWGNAITLTRIALPDHPLAPGDGLPVTFAWQAQQTPASDLTLFIHLVDAAGAIIAQSDERPLSGRFPTTVWQPGERLQETITVPLPVDSAPGAYSLRVGFYDAAGRLPLADGTADYFTFADIISIQAP